MRRTALALFATLLLPWSAARASGTNVVMGHSGRLYDATDKALVGSQSLTINLYKSADGGAADLVWTETYGVTLLNGIYALTLELLTTIFIGHTVQDQTVGDLFRVDRRSGFPPFEDRSHRINPQIRFLFQRPVAGVTAVL